MRWKILRRPFWAPLLGAFLVACGPPPSLMERDDGLASLGLQEGVVVNMEMDTLSYMSCDAPQSSDPRAYYTFRLGAYRSGGVDLPESFIHRMSELDRDKGDLFEVIRKSPVMAGARPVFSIRETENLQSVVTGSVAPFFLALDNQTFLTAVLQRPGFKFQHIPQGRKSPARWEVSRNVATTSTGVQDQEQLRARLNNYQMMLTITLGDERTGKYDYARSPFDFAENPAGYDKRVYGTGFQVGFINDRWLASVTERNLETLERKAEKKWVCPAEYRFAVPKIEDSAECSASVDPASLNSRQTAVRRALTSADWELNWTGDGQSGPHPLGRCAVPKKLGSKDLCYSPDEKYVHYISFCFAE